MLYRAPKRSGGRLEMIWGEKDQPIKIAITDTAANKTWFCGVNKKNEPFYFELSPVPKARTEARPLALPDNASTLDIASAYAALVKRNAGTGELK